MPRHPVSTRSEPFHVSIVAIPEAVVSTLTGIFDVMNAFSMMPASGDAPLRAPPPFQVEIVGLRPGSLDLVSRMPVIVQRSVTAVDATDIIVIPSILLGPNGWEKGR